MKHWTKHSLRDDLIDDIDDWVIEHDDYYFDPDSNEELAARLDDIGRRLIEYGNAAVGPLKGYLQDTRERASIIAVEVLREIGTPSAIWQLIDALESADSELRVRDRGTEDYQHTSDSVAGRENH